MFNSIITEHLLEVFSSKNHLPTPIDAILDNWEKLVIVRSPTYGCWDNNISQLYDKFCDIGSPMVGHKSQIMTNILVKRQNLFNDNHH